MSEGLYYNSIEDMPYYNWRKCMEKEQYHFCRLDPKKGSKKEDQKAWERIYDSYLSEFGLGKDYERILELQAEIASLECQFVYTNDRFLMNKIRELKSELEEFLGREVESDSDTILTYLRKWMGQWINTREITVREFYKMVRDYQREMKQRSQHK